MLTNGSEAVYLDSSALVRLAVEERESRELRDDLTDWRTHFSCGLARVEVIRAVSSQGAEAVACARAVMDGLQLIRVDDALLERAATLDPQIIRSLDAIHLAAALEAELTDMITYDRRMASAAAILGLRVFAPGSKP